MGWFVHILTTLTTAQQGRRCALYPAIHKRYDTSRLGGEAGDSLLFEEMVHTTRGSGPCTVYSALCTVLLLLRLSAVRGSRPAVSMRERGGSGAGGRYRCGAFWQPHAHHLFLPLWPGQLSNTCTPRRRCAGVVNARRHLHLRLACPYPEHWAQSPAPCGVSVQCGVDTQLPQKLSQGLLAQWPVAIFLAICYI